MQAMVKKIKKHLIIKIIIGFGLITGLVFLIHNLTAYPFYRGYNYGDLVHYSEIITKEWRLPNVQETPKFYDPPAFYIISGLFIRLVSFLAGKKFYLFGDEFYKAGNYWQNFSIIFPILSFYFWHKIIKKLIPQNKLAQLTFIVFLFSLPVLHKTLFMYSIEPFLMFTVSLTFWYFIFKFQPKPSVKKTLILSFLVIISLLTRISAIALLTAVSIGILGLAWIRQINWSQSFKFLTILLLSALIGSGWFYGRKSELYSDRITIMMNRQKGTGLPADQRLAFLTELHPHIVMIYPIRRGVWLNRFIPIYYSEFWGDFWNFYIQNRFGISQETRRADRLFTTPQRVANLALQNRVNLIPTFLMILGFIYLIIQVIKQVRKKPNFLWVIKAMFLTIFIVTWLGFLYSIVFHGAHKGDSIKASYMLFILPIFVYMLVVYLFKVVKKIKLIFIPLMVWLALAVGVNLWWGWY